MPHLVTHRPRVSNPVSGDPDDRSHESWDAVNVWAYKLGGLAFVAGSVLFLPVFDAWQYIGDWLFFTGSLLYLLVTTHDLIEVGQFWRLFEGPGLSQGVEITAAVAYVTGTVLFTVGSLFFLPDWGWTIAGAWCFVIGSLLFVTGGCVNLIQVIEAPTLIYLGLYNTTIASFLMGSTLFVVASIPFLWHLPSGAETRRLFAFISWQYIVGSSLFFWGGLAISYRTRTSHGERSDNESRTSLLVSVLRREITQRATLGPTRTRR